LFKKLPNQDTPNDPNSSKIGHLILGSLPPAFVLQHMLMKRVIQRQIQLVLPEIETECPNFYVGEWPLGPRHGVGLGRDQSLVRIEHFVIVVFGNLFCLLCLACSFDVMD
jgi:hypothetical protein